MKTGICAYLLFLLCFGSVGVAVADTPATATKYAVDIPSQALGDALQAFALASGQKLFYSSDLVAGKTSPPLKGQFTAEEGVRRLLANTGLKYELTTNGLVMIRAANAADPPSPQKSTSNQSGKEGKNDSSQDFRATQLDQAGAENQIAGEGAKPAQAVALEEVVVTGRYEFLGADTSGATNLPLPIEKVPQSISLVSADFVEAADLKTLGDIADYTPGALNVGSQENYNSLIKLRGFTAGRAVDGINIEQNAQAYEPDYAIFDRLEVVKGPASVVYGVSSPGGLVNAVTKSATSETKSYVEAEFGSWNSLRVVGQVAGSLDSEGHVRAIGIAVRDQGDSFINDINHAKTSLYGGINLDLGNSVTAFLHGGYERFVRTSFDGIPTEADGSPAPLPRSFFIGSKGMDVTTSVYHAEGDITWHANDMLEFSAKSNYEKSESEGIVSYSFGLATDGSLGLDLENLVPLRNENYGVGLSSIYHLDEIGLKNSFVSIGALYQYNHNISDALSPNGPGATANIFDGESAISLALQSLLPGQFTPYNQDISIKVSTVSVQAILQPIDPLSVLLGASYSKPDETAIANFVNNGAQHDFDFSGQVSYRAGITYEFAPKANAYLSYSQSFTPQGLIAVGYTLLPPITGDQYEAGIKLRSIGDRLLLTGALFRISEKNVGVYNTTENNIDYYNNIGVEHKGVELQALGQITPEWQINAGYAYLDPKVTQEPSPEVVGQTEVFLPKETFSAYSTYTWQSGPVRGLSVGAGVRYVGSQRTSYDVVGVPPTKDIAGYTLVDASVSYAVSKWLLKINAHNILDRRYFINNYQTLFYGNTVGDPANVALTIRREF